MAFQDQFFDIDWDLVSSGLLSRGYAVIDGLCSDDECLSLRNRYEQPELFRKTVNMARHSFGEGEYKYFSYPLPDLVQQIRVNSYTPLAKLANEWGALLGKTEKFPDQYQHFLNRCAQAGQVKATPLMLKYTKGDYNRLHQDMYGEVYFPFQLIILLSEPEVEFVGGDLVLVENIPRLQSRAHLPKLKKGSAVIIPTQERPVSGIRGWRRAKMRHGVTELLSGERHTLGIIFHDA